MESKHCLVESSLNKIWFQKFGNVKQFLMAVVFLPDIIQCIEGVDEYDVWGTGAVKLS